MTKPPYLPKIEIAKIIHLSIFNIIFAVQNKNNYHE